MNCLTITAHSFSSIPGLRARCAAWRCKSWGRAGEGFGIKGFDDFGFGTLGTVVLMRLGVLKAGCCGFEKLD